LGVLAGGVYALLASGLTLSFGIMRVVQLSHAAFLVLAAYLSYLLFATVGMNPLLAAVLIAPLFYVVGNLLYRGLLTRAGTGNPVMSVLVTFGLALFIEGLIGVTAGGIYRTVDLPWAYESIGVFGARLPVGRIVAFGAACVTLGMLFALLRWTRFGRAVRATMQDRDAARLVGIDVERVSAAAFGVALATTAAGGACLTLITTFHPAMHWEWLARLLAIVVIGGLGSLVGAGLAAFAMGIVEAMLAVTVDPTWAAMAFYLALFLVLVLRPHGLLGDPISVRRA